MDFLTPNGLFNSNEKYNVSKSFNVIGHRKNAVQRLVCFSYAGGGVSVYRNWIKSLPAEIELIALQLPGREERFREPLLTNLKQVIDHVAPEFGDVCDKPYMLFGYSLGARIAYELAVYTAQNNMRSPFHVFMGAAKPPQLERSAPKHHLSDALFVEEIKKDGGTPDVILNNSEMMKFLLPKLKADYEIADTAPILNNPYRLSCPITAFSGAFDNEANPEIMEHWSKITSEAFSILKFQDGHFFINNYKTTLVETIVRVANDYQRRGERANLS